MNKFAELKIEDKTYIIPIIIGKEENEKGLDISNLRKESGYITIDPGFVNTGACYSSITYVNGEAGILRYRGYAIEDVVENKTFIETAYLLLHGEFPNEKERMYFSKLLTEHSLLHQDMIHFFHGFPQESHPMHILATMINALSTFYPNVDSLSLEQDIDLTAARLISVLRTVAAFAYKKSIGEPFIYPKYNLVYCANFLNMMFDSPIRPYTIDEDIVKLLNKLLIVHADHEQNCSTTAVKVIGSAQVNLYSTISAGISALSGPLHGGAAQAVVEMLRTIHRDGGDIEKYINKAKDKTDKFRLMGFGHRVYRNFDPRARIIKDSCHQLLAKLNIDDPLLNIALELEEKALADDYFASRKLYPNVDFYSGIIYRAIGIPENMFTVMFVLGRLPGWIAQWKEMVESADTKIARPRQIYIGEKARKIK